MRKLIFISFVQVLLVLGGCGRGGGGGLGGGGGGSGSGSGSNIVPMTVDSGPASAFDVDTAFITVTVCAPDSTTNCEQIPNVEVDTGSYGLRVLATALSSTLLTALTPETASSGGSLVECTQFLDGFSWGPVALAEVQAGGESASAVPIQVIGDSSFENEIPSACSSTGTEEDTLASFGTNGIIGLGPFGSDCGNGCANNVDNDWYYACPSGGDSTTDCVNAEAAVNQQVTNPVVDFETDNNGIIIELPSVPDPDGSASTSGSLVFGIGTESNNGLGNATVLTADPNYGDIIATYNNTQLPSSYLDTGSNAYYFDATALAPPTLPDCPSSGGSSTFTASWLCPTSEQTLSVQNEGQSGTISDVTINIYNADTLFDSADTENNTAFDDLGADSGSQSSECTSTGSSDCYFDFGLPFFFGRNVYIAIAGANTTGGEGPYFAY
ncbi:MAG: DUF3443 family protein [Steroidobacteraceae bacterium]